MERAYRFSVGDSNTGTVGLCFDVIMDQPEVNEEEALARAKELLNEVELTINIPLLQNVRLYVNSDPFTINDIVLIQP